MWNTVSRRSTGKAVGLLRRRWAAWRVRANRCRALHRSPLGLLLAGVCGLGALFFRGWMGLIALLGRAERKAYAGLRYLIALLGKLRTGLRDGLCSWRQNGLRYMALMVLALMPAAVFLLLRQNYTLALDVTLNGEHLAYVAEKAHLDAVTVSVEQLATHHLGVPYQIPGTFGYRLELVDRDRLMNPAATSELLLSRVEGIVNEYALTVNGTLVGANESKMGLTLLKERLLEERVTDTDSIQAQFVQDLQVEHATISQREVLELDEIRTRLAANRTEAGFYTVAAGDTVSAIGLNHGLTLAQVKALNPGLDVDRIGIGDQILVSMAKPILTVEEIRVERYTEDVPFEVRQVGNSSMYVIDSRIIQKGVKGLADVTARVIYHNGVEAHREIMTYTVLEEPVDQIKEVGTKALPAWWPTGTFTHPCPGYVYISSKFGYRKSFGDNHTGTDLAAYSGTPIYAADGGTVTVAQRSGNYGLVVYIDHGNGYVTRYAHCSKLLVKAGQKVAQGEKIALVGSTGKSTGPHLHFEIRYNGTAKNPQDYLDF